MANTKFLLTATLLPALVFGAVEYQIATRGCKVVPDGIARFWEADGNECMWGAEYLTTPYTIGTGSHTTTYQSICCVWDRGVGECFWNQKKNGDIHSRGDCATDVTTCASITRHPGSDHGLSPPAQAQGTC
ncbi:uncharacterized protein MYCFIDRAFT_209460 [Pseudocercospora fijiensis CIRAD86]|uniref:Small secreted protein n=1 Tax=Pseudocercospora fijiensis (strain CIRAD86) TaxID=383855 RepID=N1Q5Q2_PSEFD|nr:uncharacterized protein MYCFIDRAFT_209460 [Pseudocercospora fijiensis CIRAD86]EME87264.1 hypothetical protein MYCFIDRAFT_209460 [Pseudocercospora fijiensis CIRAD86]